MIRLFNAIENRLKHKLNYHFAFTDFFSFPFNTEAAVSPDKALAALEKGCAILHDMNVKYTLATGTGLGAYREGGVIKGDNDLDVDIIESSISREKLNDLSKEFKKNGFNVGRKVEYRGTIQQLIFYNEHNVIFDVCIWRQKGKFFYNYLPELITKVRRHSATYYLNMSVIKLGDKEYPIPENTEGWLAMQYGEDWRIPKAKGNWVEDAIDVVPNTDLIYNLVRKFI